MHDIAIRGARIVDGSGAAPFIGDVAIQGDRIAAIGTDVGPATQEIDAQGKILTPGWVDIHSHYDGQATWDPLLSPSSAHGVTTTVMGNCGVGFAPAQRDQHDWLISLMEGVEDIPAPRSPRAYRGLGKPFPNISTFSTRCPALSMLPLWSRTAPCGAYVMGRKVCGARTLLARAAPGDAADCPRFDLGRCDRTVDITHQAASCFGRQPRFRGVSSRSTSLSHSAAPCRKQAAVSFSL